MKHLFTLFICLLISTTVIEAQQANPGNIGVDSLTAWFKATDLDLGEVTAWPSSFTVLPSGPIILSDDEFPYPEASNIGRYSNYNTAVDFIESTALNLKALELSGVIDLLDNNTFDGTGTFIAAYLLPVETECSGCHVVNYREGNSGSVDGIQFRAKLGESTGRLAIGVGNSSNGSRDYVQDFKPDLIAYSGNKGSVGSMTTYQRDAVFTGGVSSATTGDAGIYFGARRVNETQYNGLFDGLIYEVIFYNKDLSPEEYAKVHTYMAVKHGITLDNTGGGIQGNYTATNGAQIWDASDGADYHHEIVGIANEIEEGLSQKQSHTYGDSTRIYIDNLAQTNSDNLGTFNDDISYVLIGHNTDLLCTTESSLLEIPTDTTIYGRIAREWKVSNTNFQQGFSLDIRLAECADPLSVVENEIRFLVDDDGDFSNAEIYNSSDDLEINYEDGIVSINNISNSLIPNNETRYVTIALAKTISSTFDFSDEQSNLNIYPNPAQNIISFAVSSNKDSKIEIYDVLGNLMNFCSTCINIHLNKSRIDISQLPAGMYILKNGGKTGIFTKQ